jgi:hypothetical protein
MWLIWELRFVIKKSIAQVEIFHRRDAKDAEKSISISLYLRDLCGEYSISNIMLPFKKEQSMQKLFIWAIAVIILGCTSTKVVETHEQRKVEPNVQPVSPSSTPSPEPTPTPTPKPTPPPDPSVTPVQPSSDTPPQNPTTPPPTTPTEPDWTQKTILANGQSAVDLTKGYSAGQARLMAERGAIMDAQRNLMEQVLGVRIDSKTFVKDMVAQSDEIKGGIEGIIRNTRITQKNFDGSIYTVTVELKLYDVYSFMRNKKVL